MKTPRKILILNCHLVKRIWHTVCCCCPHLLQITGMQLLHSLTPHRRPLQSFSETDSVPPRRLCWRCLCLPILREQRRGDIKKLPACFKHNDVTNDKGWTGASGMHPKSLEDDEWLYHARAAYFNIACASWWAHSCQTPEKQGWNVLNLWVSRSLNPSLCWIYYTKAIDQYFGGKDACLIYDTTLNECINHKLSCLSHE